MIRRVWCAVLFVLVLGAGCSADDDDVAAEAEDVAAGAGDSSVETDDASVSGRDIEVIIADLNTFWDDADADIAEVYEYSAIPSARITIGDEGILCDGEEIRAEDVEENAFVAPCEEGILVAYDPDYVAASQARAEATLSHEWGHVIQMQAGAEVDISTDPGGLPIDAELQADCFAGAWSGERGVADFDALIADVEQTGDPKGVAIHDPSAHGSADQRRAAYQLGLESGPGACINEITDLLPVADE